MKRLFLLFFTILLLMVNASPSLAQDDSEEGIQNFYDLPYALYPTPVGSGARALGYSAFIAIADDATAASWNPAGLIQLKRPEFSVVANYRYTEESGEFAGQLEPSADSDYSKTELNYLSATYPFTIPGNRRMSVSLNYQRLYDFTRETDFEYATALYEGISLHDKIRTDQSGELSAVGLAFAGELLSSAQSDEHRISVGATLNVWDDDLSPNKWDVKYDSNGDLKVGEDTISDYSKIDVDHEFEFEGFNCNLGLLWRWNLGSQRQFSLGIVFKAPFKADIRHSFNGKKYEMGQEDAHNQVVLNEKLEMPMSYGIGVAYRFNDKFTVAADIQKTHWDDFTLEGDDGIKRSGVTMELEGESDIDPTYQVRIGAEYIFIDRTDRTISMRGGLFYDPAPAEGSPDDYYGCSLGLGYRIGRVLFDVAGQYKFGNNVGGSNYPGYDYSSDIDEFSIYSSVIVHFGSED